MSGGFRQPDRLDTRPEHIRQAAGMTASFHASLPVPKGESLRCLSPPEEKALVGTAHPACLIGVHLRSSAVEKGMG